MDQMMFLDGSNENFEEFMKQFFVENNVTEKDIEEFDLDAFLEE